MNLKGWIKLVFDIFMNKIIQICVAHNMGNIAQCNLDIINDWIVKTSM